ncbi:hypothetical protein RND71_001803 [Anisodus tanguticus]|uniref:Uncharacterized protein n=1 Tax=Anisodus tanguticus TaxID=243964 RepID=A0AAE1T363_9SOLA|nr:hypothetical protein RND71_001803 [Anisodus tanguticus]
MSLLRSASSIAGSILPSFAADASGAPATFASSVGWKSGVVPNKDLRNFSMRSIMALFSARIVANAASEGVPSSLNFPSILECDSLFCFLGGVAAPLRQKSFAFCKCISVAALHHGAAAPTVHKKKVFSNFIEPPVIELCVCTSVLESNEVLGFSQIVQAAQNSVGWFHDESDSGVRDVGIAAARRILLRKVS